MRVRILFVLLFLGALCAGTFRMLQADSELRPLAQIPGITPEILAANGETVQIADPVIWFSKENIAMFEVIILDGEHFRGEREYSLVGDARLLENFVREVRFVQTKSGGVFVNGEQAARGAGEAVEGIVESIWNVFRHPIETGKQMWGGAAGVVEYAKLAAQGKASPKEDARDFAEAFFVDQCMTVAKEAGFDFLEAQTPEAIALAQSLAKPRIAGAAGTHLLSLFAPTALLKASRAAGFAEAVSVARGVGEAATAGRALRLGARGAEKLAGFGKAMSNGEDAASTLARLAKLAGTEQSLNGPKIVKALVNPANLRTLKGRALNQRLHKLLAHLYDAERKGARPEKLLRQAMKETARGGEAVRFVDAEIDLQQLMRNFQQAKQWGLFDDAANLDKMRRGQAPTIKLGPNAGEKVGVDHIVPVSRVPELDNRFGNLRYLSDSANKSRGNRVDRDMLAKLQEYRGRGHFDQARIDAIIASKVN